MLTIDKQIKDVYIYGGTLKPPTCKIIMTYNIIMWTFGVFK